MHDCAHPAVSGAFAVPLEIEPRPHELASLLHAKDYFSFLDSSRVEGEQGQFSILAWSPELVFRSKGLDLQIRRHDEWRRIAGDPLVALDTLLQERSAHGHPEFAGGVIGYFGYDLFRVLEQYRNLSSVDDLCLPDSCLGFYDTVLVFDHVRGEWTIRGRDSSAVDLRASEVEELLRTTDIVAARAATRSVETTRSESNMSRERYIESIETALRHIAAGDIYQLNVSQRFSRPIVAEPFELFSSLRDVNPSFYGAYLNCADHVVISSSPELFLRRRGASIETRPIKGTRPRGVTRDADLALERELLASEKEAAELAMIVDLERNDLGRICDFGTVEVTERRYVDRLPTLLHTVATIRGHLRADVHVVDILRATFPGGSISGCPKISAIEIIDSLEPSWRHVYTGAIGFIGFGGEMTLSVAIRTLLIKEGRVHYHVGAGIVADSVPEAEYIETLQKAAAIEAAIVRAEGSTQKRHAER